MFLDKGKPKGLVISVDRDDIQKIEGAYMLPFSDITDKKTIEKMEIILNGRSVNSVISDMVCDLKLILNWGSW